MNKIKIKLHKFFFPKEHKALWWAMDLSFTYWQKSPSSEKRAVGEDIYMKMTKTLYQPNRKGIDL